MIDEKTDAEFIAECEKYKGAHCEGIEDKHYWVLREAIERLKRANAEIGALKEKIKNDYYEAREIS